MNSPFVLFGFDHIVTLLLVAVVSAFAFKAGQSRWASLISLLGGVIFSLLAAALWLFRITDGFQPRDDLPLWLCDIIFVLCAVCFFRPQKTLLVLITYWGLAGTLQAMITPDLIHAFPSREFLLFFVGHSVIIVGLFFLLGRDPDPRLATAAGITTAFLGLLAYCVIVGGIDALTGWNYGYLRVKPEGASVLDKMGPWPIYILGALALALILFCLIAGLLRLLWNLSGSGTRNS